MRLRSAINGDETFGAGDLVLSAVVGDVSDAYLAAPALENGATFVTRERGFARFPGLRRLDPLQP